MEMNTTQQRQSFSPGRYMRHVVRDMISGIREASKKANEKTEHEKIRDYIQYSIDNDLKTGFRPREHGNDVKQIAEDRLKWVTEKISMDKARQELEYLEEIAAVLENARSEICTRISELSGQFGNSATSRQNDIAEAYARVAKKSR